MSSSASLAIATSAASEDHKISVDLGALIGGVVGGAVVLLLVGGLIGFLVARCQQHGEQGEQPSDEAALQSVRQSNHSNLPRENNYAQLIIAKAQSTQYSGSLKADLKCFTIVAIFHQ